MCKWYPTYEKIILNDLDPLWRRWIALLTPHHSFHIIWAKRVQNSHYLKYDTSSDVKNDFEWQNPMTVHCVLIACLHKSTPHHSVKNYHYFEQTYTYNRIFSYPIPRASASGRTQFQTSRHRLILINNNQKYKLEVNYVYKTP